MRIALFFAASLLVAGCSSGGGQSAPPERASPVPSKTASASPSTSRPPTSTSAAAPAPDTPIAGVVSWVEAGTPVDPAPFHTADRDGETTDLGADVAFVTPSGTSNCMTDTTYADGALACLVELTDPPPRPSDSEGEWKGGWVDFNGSNVDVGSFHGDPGRFTAGKGPELAYGDSLKFGDYQCRVDPAALYCVNYAHQSAVRFSKGGIDTYACARQVTAPDGIGERFVC